MTKDVLATQIGVLNKIYSIFFHCLLKYHYLCSAYNTYLVILITNGLKAVACESRR